MNNLKGKIFIQGEIRILTGLHIGGSKGSIEVGEIDSNVIKTPAGVPYIPGSSLKGSIRCALEKAYANEDGTPDPKSGIFSNPNHSICRVFGVGAVNGSNATRLITRDAFLKEDVKAQMEAKAEGFARLTEDYTETKSENVISRQTGGTINGGLREMERVPAQSVFVFNMVYDVYEKKDIDNLKYLFTGFALIQDTFLGGSGTRGYGNMRFEQVKITGKTLKQYETNARPSLVKSDESGFTFGFQDIKEACNKLFFSETV